MSAPERKTKCSPAGIAVPFGIKRFTSVPLVNKTNKLLSIAYTSSIWPNCRCPARGSISNVWPSRHVKCIAHPFALGLKIVQNPRGNVKIFAHGVNGKEELCSLLEP